MSSYALCPVCGRKVRVRTDDRISAHWWSRSEREGGQPRCEGSLIGTRYWPDTNGIRHQRPHT